MMYEKTISAVVSEINQVLNRLDDGQVEAFIGEILKAKRIVLIGDRKSVV